MLARSARVSVLGLELGMENEEGLTRASRGQVVRKSGLAKAKGKGGREMRERAR